MNTKKLKKVLILSLPYVILGLLCTNIGEAWRLAEGADYSKKLVSFFSMVGVAFSNPIFFDFLRIRMSQRNSSSDRFL